MSARPAAWATDAAIATLRAQWSTTPHREIAEQLSVSLSAVYGLARKLGIQRAKANANWATDAAIARLTELWAADRDEDDIAAEFGINVSAVRATACRLQLHRPKPTYGTWIAPASIARLRKLWPVMPASAIAKQFGTTKSAIIGMAHRLELPAKGPPRKPTQVAATVIAEPTPPPTTLPALAELPTLPAEAPRIAPRPVLTAPIKPKPAPPTRYARIEPCCWVTKDGGKGRAWLYCDADSLPGKAFCSEHAKTVYLSDKRSAERVHAMGGN